MMKERTPDDSNEMIIGDIKRVATILSIKPNAEYSFRQYRDDGGRFSKRQIHEGGKSWKYWCESAGYITKEQNRVTDEILFKRLVAAIEDLGGQRYPKHSEMKKYGLHFRARGILINIHDLIDEAIKRELIPDLRDKKAVVPIVDEMPSLSTAEADSKEMINRAQRIAPPIPYRTKWKTWELIDIDGFPYAPHDELGITALFGILCAKKIAKF